MPAQHRVSSGEADYATLPLESTLSAHPPAVPGPRPAAHPSPAIPVPPLRPTRFRRRCPCPSTPAQTRSASLTPLNSRPASSMAVLYACFSTLDCTVYSGIFWPMQTACNPSCHLSNTPRSARFRPIPNGSHQPNPVPCQNATRYRNSTAPSPARPPLLETHNACPTYYTGLYSTCVMSALAEARGASKTPDSRKQVATTARTPQRPHHRP